MDARLSLANPPAEEVRARADWLASLPARGMSLRMAVVTWPELFRYGLTRVLSAYAEHKGVEMRTFPSLEAAEDWLVRDPSHADPCTSCWFDAPASLG